MGNRASIRTEDKNCSIYLHWNGGRDSIESFLAYCKLKKYPSPDNNSYGWARMCQVMGNFFGGSYSLGIDKFEYENDEDNGSYIVKNFQIINRKKSITIEQDEYELNEMIKAIDNLQPVKEQIGENNLNNLFNNLENDFYVIKGKNENGQLFTLINDSDSNEIFDRIDETNSFQKVIFSTKEEALYKCLELANKALEQELYSKEHKYLKPEKITNFLPIIDNYEEYRKYFNEVETLRNEQKVLTDHYDKILNGHEGTATIFKALMLNDPYYYFPLKEYNFSTFEEKWPKFKNDWETISMKDKVETLNTILSLQIDDPQLREKAINQSSLVDDKEFERTYPNGLSDILNLKNLEVPQHLSHITSKNSKIEYPDLFETNDKSKELKKTTKTNKNYYDNQK
jgi:hypothetical protein